MSGKEVHRLVPLEKSRFEDLVDVEQKTLPSPLSREEPQVSADKLRRGASFYFTDERTLSLREKRSPGLQPAEAVGGRKRRE